MADKHETVTIYALHFGDGVYCYVGSAVDHVKRFNQHVSSLRKYSHHNTRLQAYCAHRELTSLDVVVLDKVPANERFVVEYRWIDELAKGHPLQNIIRSEDQHKHVYCSGSVSVLRTANSLLKFNNLWTFSPIWRDVAKCRDILLLYLEDEGDPLNAQARAILKKLQVPHWVSADRSNFSDDFLFTAIAVETEMRYGYANAH